MQVLLFVLFASLFGPSGKHPAAQAPAAPTLDYEFFKARVQPIFLNKRKGLARCVSCHSQGTPFRLQPLSPGAKAWTEEESRKNLEAASRLVNPANPDATLLLRMPLTADAGGVRFHPGGRHWTSKDDPEWQTMAAWVRGAKLTSLPPGPAGPPAYDIIVRSGRVLDGTGNPFVYADVGIKGDTIAAVGDLGAASAARTVDARGRYVTPGFIALHEHIEGDVLAGRGTLPNFTTQGFTTAVINADGRSGWPIAKERQELQQAGSALNLALMVGHGTVRGMAMGSDYMRPASRDEIEKMKHLVQEGMRDGAFGLSAGLEYSPGRWSTEEEVRELAKVVAPFGGHYQAHLRSQGRYPKWQLPSSAERATTYIDSRQYTNIDAVVETIDIAKYAGIPVIMDHLHPKGPREWGSGRIITQLVDRAWAEGHRVYISMHSYEAYDEEIILVPRWALVVKPVKGMGAYDNSRDADYTNMRETLTRRLADPVDGPRIRRDIEYEIDREGGPDGLLIMNYPDKTLVGKTLGQVARQRREDPIDTAIFFQMNGFDRVGGIEFRAFAVSLLDLEEFMRQDYTGVCTDRSGASVEDRKGREFIHPGTFGTAPRRIRTFVFDKNVTTLPFAIRSLTSLAAQMLRLTDRGRIAPGQKADLVVFDPEALRDKATYFEPYQYSEGITFVIVNGTFVVDGGKPTAAKPGRVLQRPEKPSQRIS